MIWETLVDKVLGDKIPEFNRKAAADEPGISSVGLGLGESRTHLEAAIIALVAVAIIGGAEALLRICNVPQYIMPKPSQIVMALYTEWPFLWPHLVTTLYELFVGFAIGGAIGFIMAAVITQFPFVEKIVTPYILLLVTTPMLADKRDGEPEMVPRTRSMRADASALSNRSPITNSESETCASTASRRAVSRSRAAISTRARLAPL